MLFFPIVCVTIEIYGLYVTPCLQELNKNVFKKNVFLFLGTSKCPTGSVCKKFSEHFVTANRFCKQIWDGSFTVVPDEKPCMKIWFTGPNPNDEVAKWRAEQIVNAATMRATSTLNNVLAILAVGALWMLNR